jgi:hypothetical protein
MCCKSGPEYGKNKPKVDERIIKNRLKRTKADKKADKSRQKQAEERTKG